MEEIGSDKNVSAQKQFTEWNKEEVNRQKVISCQEEESFDILIE